MSITRQQALDNPVMRDALLKAEAKSLRVAPPPPERKVVTVPPDQTTPGAPRFASFTIAGIPACGTNNLYFTLPSGRRAPSSQGRKWKKTVAEYGRIAWPWEPSPSRFDVKVRVEVPDWRARDVDGFLKPILDALTGIVWKDDSQVFTVTSQKEIGTAWRVIVTVKEVEGPTKRPKGRKGV